MHAQVVSQLDHALIIHRSVADFGDDIPFLQRINRIILVGFMNHHALDVRGQFEERTQSRILQRLQLIIHGGLAVIMTIGDVLKKQLYLLAGNDVANVLGLIQAAERQTDHLVAHRRRTAAVAGIDGRINLDAQTENRKVIRGELHARNDSLRDGKTVASFRKSVGQDRVLDARQCFGPCQRRMRVEKFFIIQLEHGQIDSRSDGFHRGGYFIPGLICLDLHLAGIIHDVGIGQDAPAFNHHAAAGLIFRRVFCPWLVRIGVTHRGENLHHRIFNGAGTGAGGGNIGGDNRRRGFGGVETET